jgi:hypothetical protein
MLRQLDLSLSCFPALPFRPDSALIDPAAEDLDLFRLKRLLSERHLLFAAEAQDATHQARSLAVAGYDDRAGLSALHRQPFHVQPQLRHRALGPVTPGTVPLKDRSHVAREVNGLPRC